MAPDSDLPPSVLSHALAHALARGLFGVALLDVKLLVVRRFGALSDWLPAEGEPACACPLLLHMEDSLRALARDGGELVLPSMRLLAESGPRATISITWNAASAMYVVVTTPDHGGDQTDRLLLSERREKLLLQQQAEAAAARLRVSDALYRDLVESAGDLVLRFGVDRRVVFANRAAAGFLGLSPDSIPGRAIDALFPSADAQNPWALEAYAERPASFEFGARSADGEVRWLWWDVRFSGPEAGGEFQAVGRDVTLTRRLRAEQDKAREEAKAAALAAQRLRIAHDLHDTLARSLVTAVLEIGVAAKTTSDEATQKALAEAQAHARAGLDEARGAIGDLRAARLGLEPLSEIMEEFRARVAASGLTVRADLASEDGLPGALMETFGRVLREALRNVELHSGARHASVAFTRENGEIELRIEDDGAGFDPAKAPPGHFGLLGMTERAAEIGAVFDIASAPGAGTRVTLRAREA